MRDEYPDLDLEYVFCDTHKELPETYDYLAKIEAYLGRPIVRLSSGLGDRGFDHHLTLYRGFLPSAQVRWCTRALKIEPFEDYVGDEPARLYVGIRADEHREGYISTKPNIKAVFPFKEHGITKQDVFRILDDSGVGLPDYYEWRTRSGCYFCFFQRKSEWVGLYEEHPDLFELAQTYEKPDEGYTWQNGESLQQMIHPERIKEIKARDAKRKADAAARRRPKTLMEAFTGENDDFEEVDGCLICHL
jgi:3'-phosphoadenosine 5'-phosphosulfate sulfotransferase (PAPS reductase)/FAD synthetase